MCIIGNYEHAVTPQLDVTFLRQGLNLRHLHVYTDVYKIDD